MLVVNYNGNKPTTDYFKFSVKGNNLADTIRFIVEKQQDSFDLSNDFLVYVKCDNGFGFVDKVPIDVENDIKVVENELYVDWHLLRKHTQNQSLAVSLCFENAENEVVWQTQTFTLKIMNGIIADDEIENKYPTILQDHEQRIKQLEQGGGGGQTKYIELELLKPIILHENRSRSSLRVFLHHFTEQDIGTRLFLFKNSLNRRKYHYLNNLNTSTGGNKGFRHPLNYDEGNPKNRFGYVSMAGLRDSQQDLPFTIDIPDFMPHGGAVQTVYEITPEHIEQGYMDIDVGKEYLSLLRPNTDDDQNIEKDGIVFNNQLCIMGNGQFITYMQVDENDNVICFPINKLLFGWSQQKTIVSVIEESDNRLPQFAMKLLPF